jgi:hypothetical protein
LRASDLRPNEEGCSGVRRHAFREGASSQQGSRVLVKLENEDGTPTDPPSFQTAVPTWSTGDTILLGRDRALRVIRVEFAAELDYDPVLVVETV